MLNRSTSPFAGILEGQAPWWRIGTSGALALVGYLGLLGAALSLGVRPEVRARPEPAEDLVVTLLERVPAVAEAAPAAPSGEPSAPPLDAAPKPKPKPKSQPLATAKAIPASKPFVPQPEPEPEPGLSPPPTASLPSPAASLSAANGGEPGSGTGTGTGAIGAAAPSQITILPFTDGMTRPKLIEMVEPVYTREARDANVTGLFVAKCVITTEGALQRCRVVKGLPGMDRAVLAALARWRYTPVIYQGKPVAVDYVIQVRLDGP